MGRNSWLLAVTGTLALGCQAQAAGLPRMSFEQQVTEADIVVLAKVAKRSKPRLDESGQVELTQMEVLRVLKGRDDLKRLRLVTKGDIAERDPGCCIRGRSYLLLLRQGRGDLFEALNGHLSVFILP